MSKITLSSVTSGYDLSKVNTNFQSLVEAIDNTLSRNGTAPNSMLASIDMNSQRILNLPDPVANGEPATKGWLEALPVSTAASAAAAELAATEAAASAAVIAGFAWEGAWLTTTVYAVNNLVYEAGNTYICLVAHTAGMFGDDFSAGKWELFAAKGAAGAGTGDMIGANNLSDLTDMAVARSTLGVQPTASPTFTGTVTIPTPAAADSSTKAASTAFVAGEITTAVAGLGQSPAGSVIDYVGTTAPSGWLLLSGLTIGSATSGATARANADTETLYTLLWNSMANTEAAVSTGRGASAAADFAANKTLTLPDARGRVVAGKDNMGGSTASRITNAGAGIVGTTLGVAGGSQTHTLTTAQLASHSHTPSPTLYVSGGVDVGNSYGISGTANGTVAPLTNSSTGSGDAHNNTQPTLVLNKIIKL